MTITLTYFDFPGRAEAARAAFRYGGIEFIDKRITKEEFASSKSKLPLGQLPVLEVDGTTICQSKAILIFAGKLAGLYPEDALGMALVHQILETISEMSAFFVQWMSTSDPELKEKKGKEFQEQFPNYLTALNKFVAENGSNGYTVGDKLTIADLELTQIVAQFDMIPGMDATIIDSFPHLKKVTASCKSNPKLQEQSK